MWQSGLVFFTAVSPTSLNGNTFSTSLISCHGCLYCNSIQNVLSSGWLPCANPTTARSGMKTEAWGKRILNKYMAESECVRGLSGEFEKRTGEEHKPLKHSPTLLKSCTWPSYLFVFHKHTQATRKPFLNLLLRTIHLTFTVLLSTLTSNERPLPCSFCSLTTYMSTHTHTHTNTIMCSAGNVVCYMCFHLLRSSLLCSLLWRSPCCYNSQKLTAACSTPMFSALRGRGLAEPGELEVSGPISYAIEDSRSESSLSFTQNSYYIWHLHFSNLADALIQSDLQLVHSFIAR